MSQTLVKNYVHIVFSTKNRSECLFPPVSIELYKVIAGACRRAGSTCMIVGGYTDHVHILCSLSKNVSLSSTLKRIKSESSRWMHALDPSFNAFQWQDGYGAFSVSADRVTRVKAYIQNQKIHHSSQDYKSEFREICTAYDVPIDERYVWD